MQATRRCVSHCTMRNHVRSSNPGVRPRRDAMMGTPSGVAIAASSSDVDRWACTMSTDRNGSRGGRAGRPRGRCGSPRPAGGTGPHRRVRELVGQRDAAGPGHHQVPVRLGAPPDELDELVLRAAGVERADQVQDGGRRRPCATGGALPSPRARGDARLIDRPSLLSCANRMPRTGLSVRGRMGGRRGRGPFSVADHEGKVVVIPGSARRAPGDRRLARIGLPTRRPPVREKSTGTPVQPRARPADDSSVEAIHPPWNPTTAGAPATLRPRRPVAGLGCCGSRPA